jgi:ABC-2 type transport system permease protein
MSTLVGAGKLVRLILRRDRLLMALWILPLCLIPISYVSPFADLYPTATARLQYADNAGFTTLYGRLSGTSLGEFITWRLGFVPVMVGLISLLIVIRHTRVEEETGRRELLGATVVGRHAGLAAALAATFGANLVLAALLALGMPSQGLPANGSLVLGLQFAAAGWVFAAVGAVAAQLTSSAGSARGIATSVLGVAYLLRAAGDTSGQAGGSLAWLSWMSPIGWVQRIRRYGDERWWLVALAAGLTAVLAALAVALSGRRDVGAGLLPARPGPAAAGPSLRTPLGLAWRLHRSLAAGWTAGLAVVGVVLGDVASSVGDIVQGNQNLKELFARLGGGSGLVDAYLASIMGILGLFTAAYAIQATLRLRSEEAGGRAEPVLATAVGRLRWAGSHLLMAVLGPAAVMITAGLTTGLAYGLSTGDVGHQLPRVLAGATVQLPAVWVLAAIAVALFGLLPRLAPAAWGALAVCLVLGLVGAAVQLDQRLLDVSPFTLVPKVPGGAVAAAPLVVLAAVAVLLAAAGLVGLRRRDMPATP